MFVIGTIKPPTQLGRGFGYGFMTSFTALVLLNQGYLLFW
jgi:hypothetical protein